MRAFVAVALLASLASADAAAKLRVRVARINAAQTSWRASVDAQSGGLRKFNTDVSPAARQPTQGMPLHTFSDAQRMAVPESFDARQQWPECQTVREIRDQGQCGSCWAHGAVEFISDRECIYNKQQFRASAQDMTSCEALFSGLVPCSFGCHGGACACALAYWKQTGVVSTECYPYDLGPGCDPHHQNATGKPYCDTPACSHSCSASSGLQWKEDKRKAKETYIVKGEADMMAELLNGPCEAAFTVHEDFMSYTGGVYHLVEGEGLGGHAIKIIGYGQEKGGDKYWTVANSWGPEWGEQGFFRIRRGTNECGIEDGLYCGIPAPL